MTEISAIIITFNEERNIGRCIESLLPVMDEIIIIDSFSTDKTKEICSAYPIKFIENKYSERDRTTPAEEDGEWEESVREGGELAAPPCGHVAMTPWYANCILTHT